MTALTGIMHVHNNGNSKSSYKEISRDIYTIYTTIECDKSPSFFVGSALPMF